MPEGHTIHRLAAALSELYAGRRLAVSSPQGRFAAGAARLNGLVLLGARAHGKHLFLPFAPAADLPLDDGAVVWLRVHLGLYGAWTFDGDAEFTAPHAIGAPRRRVGERGEHALRHGGGSALPGLSGGADAAALAATALAEADPGRAPEDWDAWFEALSGRITRAGRAWDTPEMGATAAVLAIRPAGLVMANVGDCRIYRVAGGRLGRMSIDDRTQDPGSSAVTQALGGSARIDAHVWEQDLKGGTERYVLCTDGVWGALEPAELRGLCASDRAPDRVVDAVVSAIYARRAGDNCSIIVADITSAPVEGVRGRHLAASPVRSVAVETAPAGRGRRAAR